MVKLVRTNSENLDFIKLVNQLDSYLIIADGDDHSFYNQYNNIDVLKNVVVAYINNKPVGCGSFKAFSVDMVEIKRMYTTSEARGKGIATKILQELETWAKELSYSACILETGKSLVNAIAFYKKSNYNIMPNYGPYQNITNSVCLKKTFK